MKPDEFVPALELLEKERIDLAAVFAHKFWPDHVAWEGANQKVRERVYQRAFTLLSKLMYKRLISPLPPYILTDAGREYLLAAREQRYLLRLPMYDYDQLAMWYDGPVLYLKVLNLGECERGALYILADRDKGLEAFFIATLDHIQGQALVRQQTDMHTLINASARRYLLTYKYSTTERRVSIQRLNGDISQYLPVPGEYFGGNPESISKW